MLVVNRSKGSVVKGTHHIYTIAEAEDHGIVWCNWRSGQPGQWVCSDDGYVLELLKRKEYVDPRRSRISRYDVYTVWYWFGAGRITSWSKKFILSRHLRGMNNINAKPWQESFVSSRKGRAWIKLVAVMYISNNVDHMMLGTFMGFDKRYPDSTLIMVKRYLRDRLIENAIMIQMSEFLSDKGITFDQVIDDYKEVLVKAKKDGKYSDAIKILEKMERWTGLDRKIAGDHIEHSPGEDMVGSRIAQMLEQRQQPVKLLNGQMGIKIPASADQQVFDGEGNRVEYLPVEVENGRIK